VDGIDWSAFSLLVERSPLSVHALGGLQPERLETAGKLGGPGIALMRGGDKSISGFPCDPTESVLPC